MRAGKQEIAAAQSDRAELLFAQVVVEIEESVTDEARECRPLIDEVAGCLRQVAARRLLRERGTQPAPQLVEHDLGTLGPQCGAFLRSEQARARPPAPPPQAPHP